MKINMKYITLGSQPRLDPAGADGDAAVIFLDTEKRLYGFFFHGVHFRHEYVSEVIGDGFASVEDAEAAAREFYLAAQKGGAK